MTLPRAALPFRALLSNRLLQPSGAMAPTAQSLSTCELAGTVEPRRIPRERAAVMEREEAVRAQMAEVVRLEEVVRAQMAEVVDVTASC